MRSYGRWCRGTSRTTLCPPMPDALAASGITSSGSGCGRCVGAVRRIRSHGTASSGWPTIGCRLHVFCIRGQTNASPLLTQGGSPVRESRTPGSVRGVLSNGHPYRVNRPRAAFAHRAARGLMSPCAGLVPRPLRTQARVAGSRRHHPATTNDPRRRAAPAWPSVCAGRGTRPRRTSRRGHLCGV